MDALIYIDNAVIAKGFISDIGEKDAQVTVTSTGSNNGSFTIGSGAKVKLSPQIAFMMKG